MSKGHIELPKEKIAEFCKRNHIRKLLLFGSVLHGDFRPDSDIDLLIISESKERFFERQATVRRLLRDLKKKIPVSPIVLTPQELEDRKKCGDQFINEILETGIRA